MLARPSALASHKIVINSFLRGRVRKIAPPSPSRFIIPTTRGVVLCLRKRLARKGCFALSPFCAPFAQRLALDPPSFPRLPRRSLKGRSLKVRHGSVVNRRSLRNRPPARARAGNADFNYRYGAVGTGSRPYSSQFRPRYDQSPAVIRANTSKV